MAMRKLYKVWDITRNVRKMVLASSLNELVSSATRKLQKTGKCSLVLEEDGCEVDEDDILEIIPKETVFILLGPGEKWQKQILATDPGLVKPTHGAKHIPSPLSPGTHLDTQVPVAGPSDKCSRSPVTEFPPTQNFKTNFDMIQKAQSPDSQMMSSSGDSGKHVVDAFNMMASAAMLTVPTPLKSDDSSDDVESYLSPELENLVDHVTIPEFPSPELAMKLKEACILSELDGHFGSSNKLVNLECQKLVLADNKLLQSKATLLKLARQRLAKQNLAKEGLITLRRGVPLFDETATRNRKTWNAETRALALETIEHQLNMVEHDFKIYNDKLQLAVNEKKYDVAEEIRGQLLNLQVVKKDLMSQRAEVMRKVQKAMRDARYLNSKRRRLAEGMMQQEFVNLETEEVSTQRNMSLSEFNSPMEINQIKVEYSDDCDTTNTNSRDSSQMYQDYDIQ